MLFSSFFQVLCLFSAFSLAVDLPDVNLEDTWEIDPSCEARQDVIKEAYKEAALMVQAAVADLKTLKKDPAPHNLRSPLKQYADWARARRLIYFIFGIEISDDAQSHLDYVKGIFELMNKVFSEGKTIPEKGFSGMVSKPLLLCGEEMWEWRDLSQPDPVNPGQTLQEARERDIRGIEQVRGKRPIGAWVYKNIVSLETSRGMKKGVCPENRLGLTSTRYDWITLCDAAFEADAQAESAVKLKDNLKEDDGVHLRDMLRTMSWLLIHEFAHYYSGQTRTKNPEIIDVHAVNKDGQLLYISEDGKKATTTSKDSTGGDLKVYPAYGTASIVYLARTHEGKSNSGPAQAVLNAESYAAYAVTAFLNEWEWPDNNRPKALPADPGKLVEPWTSRPPRK